METASEEDDGCENNVRTTSGEAGKLSGAHIMKGPVCPFKGTGLYIERDRELLKNFNQTSESCLLEKSPTV